jgi:hypothetical protein
MAKMSNIFRCSFINFFKKTGTIAKFVLTDFGKFNILRIVTQMILSNGMGGFNRVSILGGLSRREFFWDLTCDPRSGKR